MPFKFIPEMTDRCSHRPGSGVTERTNRVPFNLALYIPEQINILAFAFSLFNIRQDLFHPACSFAAGRTLSATLMTIEARERECIFHDALVLVEYDETTGTQH